MHIVVIIIIIITLLAEQTVALFSSRSLNKLSNFSNILCWKFAAEAKKELATL